GSAPQRPDRAVGSRRRSPVGSLPSRDRTPRLASLACKNTSTAASRPRDQPIDWRLDSALGSSSPLDQVAAAVQSCATCLQTLSEGHGYQSLVTAPVAPESPGESCIEN